MVWVEKVRSFRSSMEFFSLLYNDQRLFAGI